MKFKELLRRAARITLIPSIEWKVIAGEAETQRDLLWGFAFPVVLFSAFGRDIGMFFVLKPVFGYSLNLVLMLVYNLVSWVIIPYLLILGGAYLLNFLLPRLGIQTDFIRTLKLVVYTFTPLFLLTFFIYLHPLLRMLIPIGIYIFLAYTFYVFWYGVQDMYQISLDKKLRFIVIAVLVGFIAIFLAQHIFSQLTGLIWSGMEAYFK